MSLTPFYIPDSSPLLSYGGPGDWSSAYTPRGDGYDRTFHQVTGANNTISFNLTSTGFTVSHATVSPECPLEYSINGSDFSSTCDAEAGLRELPYGLHQVILRTGNVTVFQLFGLVGSYGRTDDKQYGNTTYDESSTPFTYTPVEAWTFLGSGTKSGSAAASQDHSVAITSTSDAKVDLAFKGSAVYVYGRTGPECGQAEVTLDDRIVAHLNMTNTWTTDRVLLYTAGGLDRGRDHRLTLKNISPDGSLVVDYAEVYGVKTGKKDTPLAPLIAGVVGGIVVIILLGVVVYLYLMARIRYKIKPTLAARGAVDSWRKQTPPQSAEACSPCEAYPEGGGMSSPPAHDEGKSACIGSTVTSPERSSRTSGNWPIAKLYTRHRRQSFLSLGSEGGSTDFSKTSVPDYIPYRPVGESGKKRESIPPVPALPASLPRGNERTIFPASASTSREPKASPVTPPAIAGLDPFAERWLQENTYVGNHHARPLSTHSSGAGSVLSMSRGEEEGGGGGSTADGEAFEIVGVTHTAVNGRRSIARLWPSRDAVPSLYRSNTLTHANGPEAVPIKMAHDVALRRSNTLESYGHDGGATMQTVPISASASATAGLGTFESSANSFIRPAPTPLTLVQTSSTLSSAAAPLPSSYTPSSRNRPQTPLRRGVSIRSAKTVRSFFSNWARGGLSQDHHARPDTPARPQTAARPDSGIFPLSLGLGSVDLPIAHAGAQQGMLTGHAAGANMFIELDPSSPLTASRPPSEWPLRPSR